MKTKALVIALTAIGIIILFLGFISLFCLPLGDMQGKDIANHVFFCLSGMIPISIAVLLLSTIVDKDATKKAVRTAAYILLAFLGIQLVAFLLINYLY